jgi:hypothetical protein
VGNSRKRKEGPQYYAESRGRAFVKALASAKLSSALLKELRMAIAERTGARRPALLVGRKATEGSASIIRPME